MPAAAAGASIGKSTQRYSSTVFDDDWPRTGARVKAHATPRIRYLVIPLYT